MSKNLTLLTTYYSLQRTRSPFRVWWIQIKKEMIKKGVMKKGSKEAKEWGEKMSQARMAKKQGGSMEKLGGGNV